MTLLAALGAWLAFNVLFTLAAIARSFNRRDH